MSMSISVEETARMVCENKEQAVPLLQPMPEQNPEGVTPSSEDKIIDVRLAMRQRMSSSIFYKDKNHGWLPGELVEIDEANGIATVITAHSQSQSDTKEQEVKIKLDQYGSSQSLPLQCVDNQGSTVIVEDLRDLPYSNEASILYNLKERYEEQSIPYTRATNNVMVAINPYEWIDGLYSEEMRSKYADGIVWKGLMDLPPHLYEISSKAIKGILTEEGDQSIVVSGESGSGKTVSSKILMAHLATFHELEPTHNMEENIDETQSIIEETKIVDKSNAKQSGKKGLLKSAKKAMSRRRSIKTNKTKISENQEEYKPPDIVKCSSTEISTRGFEINTPERAKKPQEETNNIVQRVIDSNPLLEAFGNAKTCLNDNSSRFSRYSKLQFHVEDGILHRTANIAGSTCHTFLLEKSRVVSHDPSNDEQTFHIFYQLMKAPREERERIWKGFGDKTGASFKYIGTESIEDEYTNRLAWKNTVSALNTIGVIGENKQMLLLAICIVLQLGNLVFIPNPLNEEETIIANTEELKILSDMIGIPVSEISNCLTHKIMKTNRDTFKVPLKVADAKSTCDALAKECYRATFDWLVGEINESTCADKNYKQADQVSEYNCISVLDICGFECFEINGFEQLLINHTNERLQKTFTETIIDGVMEEYNKEGIPIENIEHDDNGTVIRFLEGRMGLMSLLNEECILPRGSDAEFVHKIYATHKIDLPSSKLFFEKNFQLAKNSKCMFGIQHFAKDVIYDGTGFLKKNKDTLPFDVVSCAIMSTNSIIRDGLLLHESSTPKKKSALTGTSLWTSFEKQMTNLFSQIKQTRVWFVRCIIPNNDKEPFSLDLKCSLNQLRSVGLLAAMKMSQACFPNKQCFEYILHRFWFLSSLGKKYAFGKVEGSEADIRGDCEQLLKSLLTSVEDIEPFVIGRTRVYFREGALEQLEAERSKAYDKGASKIQAQVRGIVTRRMYTQMRIQSAMETEVVRHHCDLCIIQ